MNRKIAILEDIFRILTDIRQPDQVLNAIVMLITDRLGVDVCSVYVLDQAKQHLVLKATEGLKRQAVGRIRMRGDEGLAGLTLERRAPVFVVHPERHPRFKHYADSGEETCQTFLGLPLIYHQQVLGVLVVQTIAENGITDADISFFAFLSSQISATVAYSGLLEGKPGASPSILTPRPIPDPGPPREKRSYLKGISVAEGFAAGQAHYIGESIGFDQIHMEQAEDPQSEIVRLEEAFNRAAGEIKTISREAENLLDQDEAILEAYLMFLRDKSFKRKMIEQIQLGLRAEYALKKVVLEYLAVFQQMEDLYMRERGADIEDIGRRLLRHLIGWTTRSKGIFDQDTIIIAVDLSPVELVRLRQPFLKGIVLARGGRTSHTVILARSFELPVVVGVEGILETVQEHDHLIVDGNSGLVFCNPPRVIIDEYRRMEDEKAADSLRLAEEKALPARTRDGFTVHLGANIGLLSDLPLVKKYGADHIGLYRTEFPFLVRRNFPTEDEQVDLYCKMIEGAEGRAITIRTIDVGGDKFLSYLDYPREENPYLGWRAVRVSLALESIFRIQIRAILRAAAAGPMQLLFPMITTVGEMRQIQRIIQEEKDGLSAAKIPFDPQLPIGVMVEVPGAVKILDHLLAYADFVSIGTNDLVQYLLAVDRNNEKVAALYTPLHPAVISTVMEVVAICRARQVPVTVCGEAAANLKCVLLFIGMGIDRLSMNAASIPLVRRLIRSLEQTTAAEALKCAMAMEEADHISDYLATLIDLP